MPQKCKNFYIHLPTVSHGSSLWTQKSFLERKQKMEVNINFSTIDRLCDSLLIITWTNKPHTLSPRIY